MVGERMVQLIKLQNMAQQMTNEEKDPDRNPQKTKDISQLTGASQSHFEIDSYMGYLITLEQQRDKLNDLTL